MTDAAAPAAAPAVAAPADAAPVKGAPAAEAKTPPSWGDADKKAMVELFKKSPYRVQHKGESKAIESDADIESLFMDAQRAKGATKVVEEAKKEREAAAKERAEAQRFKELTERARKGDREARRELLGESPDEAAEREDAWAKLTPTEKQLLIEREERNAELEALRQEKQQREQSESQRRQQAELAEAHKVVTSQMVPVLEALNIAPSQAEYVLPHVAGAIADLQEQGLEIGVDMTPQLLITRVKQRLANADETHLSKMEPKAALGVTLKMLEGLDDGAFMGHLPKAFQMRVARLVARGIQQAKAQPGEVIRANDNQSQSNQRQERSTISAPVLSPVRWGKR